MEAEIEELKVSKEQERKKHKDKIYELEREVVKEKDRLKKDMELQMQEARKKLLELANTKLETVILMTIVLTSRLPSSQ
jgi:hypothetical protein